MPLACGVCVATTDAAAVALAVDGAAAVAVAVGGTLVEVGAFVAVASARAEVTAVAVPGTTSTHALALVFGALARMMCVPGVADAGIVNVAVNVPFAADRTAGIPVVEPSQEMTTSLSAAKSLPLTEAEAPAVS